MASNEALFDLRLADALPHESPEIRDALVGTDESFQNLSRVIMTWWFQILLRLWILFKMKAFMKHVWNRHGAALFGGLCSRLLQAVPFVGVSSGRPQPCSLLETPSSVLQQILGFLDGPDLARFQTVCKQANLHGSAESLWKSLSERAMIESARTVSSGTMSHPANELGITAGEMMAQGSLRLDMDDEPRLLGSRQNSLPEAAVLPSPSPSPQLLPFTPQFTGMNSLNSPFALHNSDGAMPPSWSLASVGSLPPIAEGPVVDGPRALSTPVDHSQEHDADQTALTDIADPRAMYDRLAALTGTIKAHSPPRAETVVRFAPIALTVDADSTGAIASSGMHSPSTSGAAAALTSILRSVNAASNTSWSKSQYINTFRRTLLHRRHYPSHSNEDAAVPSLLPDAVDYLHIPFFQWTPYQRLKLIVQLSALFVFAAWAAYSYHDKLAPLSTKISLHLLRAAPILYGLLNIVRLAAPGPFRRDEIRASAGQKLALCVLVLFFVENVYYSMQVRTPFLWLPFELGKNFLRVLPTFCALVDLAFARKRWHLYIVSKPPQTGKDIIQAIVAWLIVICCVETTYIFFGIETKWLHGAWVALQPAIFSLVRIVPVTALVVMLFLAIASFGSAAGVGWRRRCHQVIWQRYSQNHVKAAFTAWAILCVVIERAFVTYQVPTPLLGWMLPVTELLRVLTVSLIRVCVPALALLRLYYLFSAASSSSASTPMPLRSPLPSAVLAPARVIVSPAPSVSLAVPLNPDRGQTKPMQRVSSRTNISAMARSISGGADSSTSSSGQSFNDAIAPFSPTFDASSLKMSRSVSGGAAMTQALEAGHSMRPVDVNVLTPRSAWGILFSREVLAMVTAVLLLETVFRVLPIPTPLFATTWLLMRLCARLVRRAAVFVVWKFLLPVVPFLAGHLLLVGYVYPIFLPRLVRLTPSEKQMVLTSPSVPSAIFAAFVCLLSLLCELQQVTPPWLLVVAFVPVWFAH